MDLNSEYMVWVVWQGFFELHTSLACRLGRSRVISSPTLSVQTAKVTKRAHLTLYLSPKDLFDLN